MSYPPCPATDAILRENLLTGYESYGRLADREEHYPSSSEMSDLDDMPELVDSSEGEEVTKLATNLDYVMAWLTSRKKHLVEHHHSIRKCTYGPLLFGFANNVPKMWITALHHSHVLLTKNREKDVTPLSKEEWEMTDMLTEVFNHANPKMKSREHLKCALDAVDEIEKQALLSNDTIDVKRAIEKAQEFKTFQNLWNDISVKTRMKKNPQAAQFCILYVFKNFHYHVLGYGRDGKLIENEIKALWSSNKSSDDAEQSKEKGNKAFKENKFDLAVRWYTQAIRKDPLSHIFFGNRSQAYLKLKKFREALCDGLRAITLDQDWAKGYYRYAEAYFELGMLDKAREINHIGRQACQRTEDKLNLRQIDEQRERFKTEKQRLGQLDKNIWLQRRLPDLVSDSNDSDLEEDGVPGLISDSDDNYPPVKSTKLRRKQDSRKKLLTPFKHTLREGSDALEKGLAEVARAAFEKALDTYSSSNFLQKDVTECKVVVLKYAFAISGVATGNYAHIMEAIHRFEEISNTSTVKFPASYYGLGKAYVTLNRYTEATVNLNSGLSAVRNGVRCDAFCWPGTDKVIPESKKDKLEALLRELLQTCKRPPTPDAVCRHGNCQEDRDVIYFSDPDFKGFVRVNCQSLCVVEFHVACWKSYKGKGSDKEQLDKSCPTPDCSSFIQRICLYRHNADPKVYTSDKPLQKSKNQKKLLKLEPSSQDKISRKAEKKALRKQKRKEAREAEAEKQQEEEEEEDTTDALSLAQQVLEDESELKHLAKADTVLYKKEQAEEATLYKGKPKLSKPKKEKKKSKQVLNVEVNFSDRREDQLLGEHSVLSDTEDDTCAPRIPRATYNSDNPFSVPPSLHQKVQDFNSVYDQSINPQNNKHNEVANNLFVYFAELLGEHGPLHVNDSVLTKELEDFPMEAREVIDTYGGLRGFLQQSLKFGLIDNYVCLLKDAVHARSLAVAHKTEYPTLGAKQTVPSDVKTKPRSVNSVVSSDVNKASKVSLNPAAQEFKPQPSAGVFVEHCVNKDPFVINAMNSCEARCEIDKLVKTVSAAPRVKPSTYNSLDDFSLPSQPNSSKSAEKTLLENMDDIDDFQLCADDLEDDLETTNNFSEPDWSRESWEGGSDSVSESISLAKIRGVGSKILDSALAPSSVKSDDLDPSRCSSRSSHSELGEFELGYRTVSPALQSQGFKSAYSRTTVQKEVSNDVFSSSSFHNSDSLHGNLDLLDTKRKNSLDKTIIPPHPFLSSSSKDAFGSFDSRPSSCDSPLAHGCGDASESSVTSIWGSSPTPIYPKASQDNGFNTFQDRLTKTAQQSVYSPFPSLASLQSQDNTSSTWSPADGLEPNTASSFTAANTPESYSLFGLDKSSVFSQDHNWLKPKSSVDVQVQTVYRGVSVSTNTDLDINSLFLHYKAMQEQHTQLVATLHKAQEEKISLTAATKQLMLEKMKTTQEQQMYVQQVELLKQQIGALQQLNHSMEEKLKQESLRTEEYLKKNVDTRETFQKEKAEMVASLTELQSKYISQRDRAVAAEQEYVQLKMQVSLQSFSAAKREATFHHHHVLTYIRKFQEDKRDLPAKVKQILSHLSSVIETCDARIADIKAQCEKNVQLLKEGQTLGDLPAFTVATPPVPMPPEIAALMSQIFGTGTVNSSKLSMRLSPTESGSKSLQMFQSPPNSHSTKASNGGAPQQAPKSTAPTLTSKPMKASNGLHNGTMLQPKPIQPLGFPGGLQVALAKPARVPMTTAKIHASLLNSPSLQPPTLAKMVSPQQSRNSYDKLIAALQSIFPNYNKSEFLVLIRELREARGGSLTGMGLEDIVKNITDTVLEREGTPLIAQTPTAPPPGFSNSWGVHLGGGGGSNSSSYKQLDLFLDVEENPCAICHEELENQETRDLDCGHTFHVECIRTWFKEQSTCPNCRVHALLPDDFPTLK
ncbi:E3 ubiquitin-protein ligase TTC3-like [Haliotis cracherodii]|uniref:E3 ubiquitin-protein ligase TTC3-like n=1 Tax=Haliotis cracherodii TaxID=6455 RepID=UPI0039E9E7B3